jgi:hypothetical protein
MPRRRRQGGENPPRETGGNRMLATKESCTDDSVRLDQNSATRFAITRITTAVMLLPL